MRVWTGVWIQILGRKINLENKEKIVINADFFFFNEQKFNIKFFFCNVQIFCVYTEIEIHDDWNFISLVKTFFNQQKKNFESTKIYSSLTGIFRSHRNILFALEYFLVSLKCFLLSPNFFLLWTQIVKMNKSPLN